jgi:hypothetical protein
MTKFTLWELCEKLYSLDSTIEDINQEELPVELLEALEELLQDRNTAAEDYYQKINSILNLIKSKQQWMQIRQERIQELKRLVEIDQNLAKKLNSYLLTHLQANDLRKFRTADFNVSVVRNGGRPPLKISEQIDVDRLPAQFTKVKLEASKEAIREYLEAGGVLDYAFLAEREEHLRFR